MKIHNIVEDLVVREVNAICDSIEKTEGARDGICTCGHCRQDAACYVLNRVPPFYIVSNRGLLRAERHSVEYQQMEADISALSWKALEIIGKQPRPHCARLHPEVMDRQAQVEDAAYLFYIPAIVGRVFNAANFSPMNEMDVNLLQEGKAVPMADEEWQNPCHIVPKTDGSFSFWPKPVPASSPGVSRTFHYTVQAKVPGFGTLQHSFEVPVRSEKSQGTNITLDTCKLADLHMFPEDAE